MKFVSIIVLALVFCGCAAQMVSTRGDIKDPNAPVNEGKGGTVRYGYDMSRSSAYKKMHEYCGGPYNILKEEARNESVAGGYNAYKTNFVYIDFECVKE